MYAGRKSFKLQFERHMWCGAFSPANEFPSVSTNRGEVGRSPIYRGFSVRNQPPSEWQIFWKCNNKLTTALAYRSE